MIAKWTHLTQQTLRSALSARLSFQFALSAMEGSKIQFHSSQCLVGAIHGSRHYRAPARHYTLSKLCQLVVIRTRRQGFDETACSTIELWPRMLEPPGFEPGTSCLKACSSIGIRRENGLCALIFTCGSLGLVQTPLLFQPEQVRRSKHQASIF